MHKLELNFERDLFGRWRMRKPKKSTAHRVAAGIIKLALAAWFVSATGGQ